MGGSFFFGSAGGSGGGGDQVALDAGMREEQGGRVVEVGAERGDVGGRAGFRPDGKDRVDARLRVEVRRLLGRGDRRNSERDRQERSSHGVTPIFRKHIQSYESGTGFREAGK